MIALMTLVPREEGLVYIDELARVVNREMGTIRKWEREGRLPKRLLPKRGTRNWRCWTHNQVYGKNGVIEWMRKNDMRPGNTVTDPSKEDEHVAHLRKPKYLTGHQIRGVRDMVAAGRTRRQIINRLYKKTRYSSPENLEKVLERYFKAQGWDFPPAPPKLKPKVTKKTKAEIKALEKRIENLGK